MIFILFVYGLAFVICGLAVAVYPTRGSDLPLARLLPAVGAFALLHGAGEWVDMFSQVYPAHNAVLIAAKSALLVLSFVALLAFGLAASTGKPARSWAVPAALL